MAEGGTLMEFIQIILDFVTLGAFGLFSTITLMIWFSFCDVFIFEEGYLQWLKNRPVLKIIVVLISGILIWGSLLIQTHQFLWSGDNDHVVTQGVNS